MPEANFFISPVSTVQFSLEPAFNAVASLRLLNWSEMAGLDPWVNATLKAMKPKEFRRHQLVMIGLYYIVNPDQSYASFPAYIDHLAQQSPLAMRNQLLDKYLAFAAEFKENGTAKIEHIPTRDAMIADKDAYMNFLTNTFAHGKFDPALEAEAYDLFMDLPRMQETIVSHLRHMWTTYLEPEWQRVQPMLQESVDAFQQVDFSEMSLGDATDYVLGQNLSERKECLINNSEQVIFVPSPHMGASPGHFTHGTTTWITFAARLPAGMHSTSSALTRAELLVRLSSLADETRLRILALFVERGELCGREVRDELGLTQSAASRHLSQLAATGLLSSRKQENAKCYRLNEARISDTISALQQFLNT